MENNNPDTTEAWEASLKDETDAEFESRMANIEATLEKERAEKLAKLEEQTPTILKLQELKSKNELLDLQLKEVEQNKAKELKTITADTLLAKEFPETKWLVDDLIPAEGFTAITGAPFSYKSFITEHLAICIATGSPLFNHFPVQQGNILLIDKENAQSLIQDRLKKLGCIPNSNIFILEDPDHYNLRDQNTLQSTIDFIKENKVNLVVLDSFVQVHKGDENDSMSVVETFQLLKQLPCAVLFIHHHRKTIKFFTGTLLESIRGSSDIGAELESHLAVDQMDGKIRVTQGKNRRGILQKPFTITPIITETSITFQYEGEVVDEVAKSEKARYHIIEQLQINGEMSRKLLTESLSEVAGRDSIDKAIRLMESKNEVTTRFEGRNKYLKLSPDVSPDSGDTSISLLEQAYLEEIE